MGGLKEHAQQPLQLAHQAADILAPGARLPNGQESGADRFIREGPIGRTGGTGGETAEKGREGFGRRHTGLTFPRRCRHRRMVSGVGGAVVVSLALHLGQLVRRCQRCSRRRWVRGGLKLVTLLSSTSTR